MDLPDSRDQSLNSIREECGPARNGLEYPALTLHPDGVAFGVQVGCTPACDEGDSIPIHFWIDNHGPTPITFVPSHDFALAVYNSDGERTPAPSIESLPEGSKVIGPHACGVAASWKVAYPFPPGMYMVSADRLPKRSAAIPAASVAEPKSFSDPDVYPLTIVARQR